MTRGKQKIEAQKRNAEKNQKSKGSQLEARAVGLKVICPICKLWKGGLVDARVAWIINPASTDSIIAAAVVPCMHWWGCRSKLWSYALSYLEARVQLANQNQLVDHYASKHPKEKPPAESS
ncbi:hypothetical protein V8G54_016940 [Vigna mungo]|uniref:Small EDRK-rich factor-like N-terminal domain-containing protein n=1 Tax=Vigna mungo TaxID=3915 RepID=A0AAQ3NMD4_VIGMU